MPIKPIHGRPETLAERVYESLRQAITSTDLPPAARVTEAGLAEQLNVSKTPVREALLRLAHVGLVEADSDRRLRVAVPSLESIRQAYEVRLALEGISAQLATQRAADSDIVEIVDLADASLAAAEQSDRLAFRDYDRQFHLAIAASAGNDRLERTVRDIIDLVSALRDRDVPGADASTNCATQHQHIALAIRARDADQARLLSETHIRTVQDLVLEKFRAVTQRTAFAAAPSSEE